MPEFRDSPVRRERLDPKAIKVKPDFKDCLVSPGRRGQRVIRAFQVPAPLAIRCASCAVVHRRTANPTRP